MTQHFAEQLEQRVTKTRTAKNAAPAASEPKKKGRKPVQRGKDKGADFIRLGEIRLTKACEGIRLYGNLSDTNSYEFTEEQVEMGFDRLHEEIEAARARFRAAYHRIKRAPISLLNAQKPVQKQARKRA